MEKLGHVKLQELNMKILENFYQYLRHTYISPKTKRHLSTTTIRSYYDIINNMLDYAVKCCYIVENPNAKIDKPKKAKTNIPYYTPEEVEKLIFVLQFEPIKYQAIILLALDLGCRRGELTGLNWTDIDFQTGRVQINKTTQSANGKIFEKGTYSSFLPEMKAFDEIHLCGFDTDACIYKTAMDLIESNVRPIVLKDYCFSEDETYHQAGLKLLERNIGKQNIK
jgi:hypothetical protein